jgi:hypothetical protein
MEGVTLEFVIFIGIIISIGLFLLLTLPEDAKQDKQYKLPFNQPTENHPFIPAETDTPESS